MTSTLEFKKEADKLIEIRMKEWAIDPNNNYLVLFESDETNYMIWYVMHGGLALWNTYVIDINTSRRDKCLRQFKLKGGRHVKLLWIDAPLYRLQEKKIELAIESSLPFEELKNACI